MRLFSNNEIILGSTNFCLLHVELGRDIIVHLMAYVFFLFVCLLICLFICLFLDYILITKQEALTLNVPFIVPHYVQIQPEMER